MDFKKLAEMAKIQTALEEDTKPINPPPPDEKSIIQHDESEMGIYIPVEDDFNEPEQMPDDGFTSATTATLTDDDINTTGYDFEPFDVVMSRCFSDEKAYNIELERLIPYHSPVFSEADDVTELKASISRIGVTEPLLIKSAGNGEYEILDGSRRKRAAEQLLWTKVPCRIADNDTLDENTEKRIIVECNRSRLEKIELTSEKIRVCAALGAIESAKQLKITNEQAERFSRLNNLDQQFLKMIDGGLAIEAVEALSELTEKQQKQVLAVLEQHSECKITVYNASELAELKQFTAASIAKVLKPKPPVNVAISAETISEYFNGKTPEEISELVTVAIISYFQ